MTADGRDPGAAGSIHAQASREPGPGPRGFRVQRLFWLAPGLAALLVLLVLAGLVAMPWRSLDRLQPVQAHLAHIARLQSVSLNMEQILLNGLRGVRASRDELEQLRQEVLDIAGFKGEAHPDSGQRLDQIAGQITPSGFASIEAMVELLARIRTVLAGEWAQHDRLLAAIASGTRLELRLALAVLVILPLAGGIGLLFLQRRVEQPIRDLQSLLDRLAAHDFRPVPDDALDRATRSARPAFDSYNVLVRRLRDLEAEHADRERLLAQRVRQATEALLAQSRELSRAERLAAVGAVSAGVAHELRNPLAGVLLACSKLQKQLAGSPEAARIATVIAELQRMDRLLTGQLDAAWHEPERPAMVDVAQVVGDLFDLLHYQVPAAFTLSTGVGAGLLCMLPVAGLRQALLNLVLNAVQVQGENGRVEINAHRDGESLLIDVSDDGPGFPDTMLRAGIRPFATGRAGGTGLGLAMVRRFVRDLDGDLVLDNRAPRGARVSLRLPCPPVVESAGPPAGPEPGASLAAPG